MRKVFAMSSLALVFAGCDAGPGDPKSPDAQSVDLGLSSGYDAKLILKGLNNPSHVSFRPGDNALTVCDSGNGMVLVNERGVGHATKFVSEFDTEFWKIDTEKKVSRYKLGPLCASWLGETSLVVSDGGHPDSKDTIAFFDKPCRAADAIGRTNAIAPTSTDAKDKGEGNFTGFAVTPDRKAIYVCSHGADAKTWILRCDVETRKLEPLLSADDHGIATNSPMQALLRGENRLLVLYSGAGGVADGLLVEWDLVEKKPIAQWKLPGLNDPMGMDFLPGHSDELAVVDNNWSLTQVNEGRLAHVRLPSGGGEAEVLIVGTKLKGPVSCAFGPDARLYIAQLGEAFDEGKGTVVSVGGLK
ncbi:MAG TPA: hypothetical protein VI643_01585 [Planctomycetota bacterium]|nr:hypothetical protein [Planctomycetota bacterium]